MVLRTLGDWAHIVTALQGLGVFALLGYLLFVTTKRISQDNFESEQVKRLTVDKWWLMLAMSFTWLASFGDTGWWSVARIVGANDGDPNWVWMFNFWWPLPALMLGIVAGVMHVRTLWPWSFRYHVVAIWIFLSCLVPGLWLLVDDIHG